MISFIEGNLFDAPELDAIGHGVNCVGRMGRGIAAQFRRRRPAMFAEYEARCRRRELRPGDLFAWFAGPGWIYNLATQHGTGPRATLPAIRLAVGHMLAHARAANLCRVGLPRVGCGIGGLDWADVRPVLQAAAAQSPVELVIVSLPGEL